jgi:prophage tail gpP-like protein
MAGNYSTVRMQFGDGSVIDSWLSLDLRDTYTDPLGTLDFVTVPPRSRIGEYRELLQKGELVTVFANDVNQGTFLITTRTQAISKDNGCIFQVTCKSPLVTAVEGSVKPGLSKKDQELGQLIALALQEYGFDIVVADPIANVSALTGKRIKGGGAKKNTKKVKIADIQTVENERAYQFVSRLCSRRSVALRMAVDGTLLLTAPNYDQEIAYSLVEDSSGTHQGDRFFGTVTITDTNDEQYSECQIRGSSPDRRGDTQSAHPKNVAKSTDISATRPPYRGGVAAAYKPFIFLDKQCHDSSTAKATALHALGYRARNAFTVRGEVGGFVSKTGRLWQVDTMAHVVIEEAGIDEDMWILERSFLQDREQGQRTQLTLIPKGALVLGEDVD